jgi:hypothetical protein
MSELLAAARAYLAEEAEIRARQVYEFAVTRPSPRTFECVLDDITMPLLWDLSPIDPQSFDPTEPPGRPSTPPVPSVAPVVTGNPVVGSVLTTTNGTWSGAPTFTRQWRRNATAVGTGALTYTLVAADEGALMSCDVTATNASGGVTASSNQLGPVTPAGEELEGSSTRRKR